MSKVFNKNGKKSFNKKTNEEKLNQATIEISKKISSKMVPHLLDSMLRGMEVERNRIYKNHVAKIDNAETELEKKKLTEKMLSYLRMEHLSYIKKYGNEIKGETK